MVSYAEVLKSNESLKSSSPGLTAVFVGATSGIGLGALRAFTKHTSSPTVFIVGRSETTLSKIINELKSANTTATFIPVQADDLTLLSNVNKACGLIKSHPSLTDPSSKIDILALSPGYISFASRAESAEGLDKITSIRYYARMRFVVALLPLLRAAPSPRVISVLAGGKEGQLWPDDFHLKSHYSVGIAAGASASMTTLFMEELASQKANEKISTVHLFPGLVADTGLSQQTEHFGPVMRFLFGWIVLPLLSPFAYTAQEAGERVLFAATEKERFPAKVEDGTMTQGLVQKGSDGKVGSGVYLVQGNSSTVEAPKVLSEMRNSGVGDKLYAHTMEEFEKVK